MTYTSFDNVATTNGQGGVAYSWMYDENHARIKETRGSGGNTRTTWYLNPDNVGGLGFETEIDTSPASQSNRHYIVEAGKAIGVLISTGPLPTLAAAQSSPTLLGSITLDKVEYWHKDHLGSLSATTDHLGQITAHYTYDPFGKRRFTNGNYDALGQVVSDWNPALNAGTARGFTGQEEMDDIGLVNLNGRIYDPSIGRFVQVDPHISDPSNLQLYDRYAYVGNNPLNATDPSGFDGIFIDVGEVTSGTRGGDTKSKSEKAAAAAAAAAAPKSAPAPAPAPAPATGDSSGYASNNSTNQSNQSQNSTNAPSHQDAKEAAPHVFPEVGPGMAASRDEIGFLKGDVSEAQLNENAKARAAGAAIGAVGAAGIMAGAEVGSAEALNAGGQILKQRAGDIGKNIVGWGNGQSADAVAQTIARAEQINPKVVEQMARQGLTREWVEKQAAQYSKALEAGGRKLINEQLVPRLELMQKILQNWTK